MHGFLKRTLAVILTAILIFALMLTCTLISSAESEVFYTYTLTSVPVVGDNVLGSLTWNFSMAGNGTVESGSSGRGARFAIGDSPSHELVARTTITGEYISSIVVEAARAASVTPSCL